jgi:hypothetical protein
MREMSSSNLAEKSDVRFMPRSDYLLPKEIVNATHGELNDYMDCYHYFKRAVRPTNHKPIWDKLRRLYTDVMKPESSIISRLLHEETAILVPYSVREIKGKGLGLFANENIPNGTLIDDARRGGRVKFTQGDDYRRFVYSARTPDLACLALRCSTVESTTGDTDPRLGAFIAVDLDDSCFMNTARGYKKNVGMYPKGDCPTACDYAIRNIEAGEELSTAYGDYSYSRGWKWFML